MSGTAFSLSAVAVVAAAGVFGTADAQGYDPVVFTFATVGDNRQDPKSPDPTTYVAAGSNPATQNGGPSYSGAVLLQDQEYLQNSAAWSVIQQGILSQGAQLLFFNGDMIYGYGRPILPSAWTTTYPITKTGGWTGVSNNVYPDAFYEYAQYAYWRGTVSTMFNEGTYVIPVPGNHETQCSITAVPYGSAIYSGTGANGGTVTGVAGNPNCPAAPSTNPGAYTTGKAAFPENENAFRANTNDLVQDLVSNVRFSAITGVFATNVTGNTAATAIGSATAVACPVGATSPVTVVNGVSTPCYYSAGTPANNGAVANTQNGLDYSFDIPVASTNGGPALLLHFAVINTDPSGADATAPSDWLAGDFAAAAGRGTTNHQTVKYFVFGHKPAFTYNYDANVSGSSVAIGGTPGAGGLDANLSGTNTSAGNYSSGPLYQNLFWHVIAQYNASYFCGHEHTVNVRAIADPTGGSSNTPFQVIVGSGGSPFDDKMTTVGTEPSEAAATDRYYAWGYVQVHASGAVTLQVSGFPDTAIGQGVYDLQNYDVPGQVFQTNLQ